MPANDTDQLIMQLAVRFAADVRRVVEASLRQELTAELAKLLDGAHDRRASRVSPIKGRPAADSRPTITAKRSKTNELKRIAATKPVACRVVGCANPGVRAFGNICHDHHAALYSIDKNKVRATQAT